MYGAGAAFFCLEPEPEPTQVGRSRSWSRLRDLGDLELEPEQEPPKKVAAPQHCSIEYSYSVVEQEPVESSLF